MSLFDFLKRKKGNPVNIDESSIVVEIDDKGVSCTRPNDNIEHVDWDDLQTVFLQNTDQGPFVADVFWVLLGEKGGCVVPQGATGEKDLLHRLQALPGFDNEAVCKSMTCTANERFLCWKKA